MQETVIGTTTPGGAQIPLRISHVCVNSNGHVTKELKRGCAAHQVVQGANGGSQRHEAHADVDAQHERAAPW